MAVMFWNIVTFISGCAAVVAGTAVVESERKERRVLYLFLFCIAALTFLGSLG